MTIRHFISSTTDRLLFLLLIVALSVTGCGGSDESESSVAAQSDSDSTAQVARSPTRSPARERPRSRACIPVSDDVNVPVILTPACDDPLPAVRWPDNEIGEGTDPDPGLFCDVVGTVDPIDLPLLIEDRDFRFVNALNETVLPRQLIASSKARAEFFCIAKAELTNDDLNFAHQYLKDRFTAAAANSAAAAIDGAVARGSKLIMVGEAHWGDRPYYAQMIDRFVNRETDVVFIEANASSQQTLDKYLAGRATMKELNEEDKKTINWSQVLQHAKEKRIPVKAVDTEGADRDQFMAGKMHEHMTNGRYRRGIMFVGAVHLESLYNVSTQKEWKAIPGYLRGLGYAREDLVDIITANGPFTSAFHSYRIPPQRGELWRIPTADLLTKGIVLETNADTAKLRSVAIAQVPWVRYIKSPHTLKTAHLVINADRQLPGW